jgi:hypothetical protein
MEKHKRGDVRDKRRVTGAFVNFLDKSVAQYRAVLEALQDAHWQVDVQQDRRVIREAIYRNYMCQGDLARYKENLQEQNNTNPSVQLHDHAAFSFYCKAIMMDHRMGLPYNQLGVISRNKRDYSAAMYDFVRASCCAEPYAKIDANFKLLFSQVAKDAAQKMRNLKKPTIMLGLNKGGDRFPMTNQQRTSVFKEFKLRTLYLQTQLLDPKAEPEIVRALYTSFIDVAKAESKRRVRRAE